MFHQLRSHVFDENDKHMLINIVKLKDKSNTFGSNLNFKNKLSGKKK